MARADAAAAIDRGLAAEIGRRLAQGLVVFPLLWIAASFGPVVVTALEVGRRVRALINSVNWGLSLAASSLVGQHLGARMRKGRREPTARR